jgi:hypothetical protein
MLLDNNHLTQQMDQLKITMMSVLHK